MYAECEDDKTIIDWTYEKEVCLLYSSVKQKMYSYKDAKCFSWELGLVALYVNLPQQISLLICIIECFWIAV